MKDLFSIKGKIALVTGGSRGIGEMIAAGFLSSGAKVYICSRKVEACNLAAEKLSQEFGGECISIPTDLSNMEGIENLVKEISNKDEIISTIISGAKSIIQFKKENFDEELFNNFQKFIILRTIDEKWQDHLYTMDQLREGIGLRAYGQKNPLIEYKQEGFGMFAEMMVDTNKETLKRIFRTDLASIGQRNMKVKQKTKNLQAKKMKLKKFPKIK